MLVYTNFMSHDFGPITRHQERILKASIAILTREGSRALTMKRVAEELGLTEAAIYRHFPCKKALLAALYAFVKAGLLARIAPVIASETSPKKRIRALLSATLRYLFENKGVTIVLLAEAIYQHDEEINCAMRDLFTGYTALAETLIQAGVLGGFFDPGVDPRLAATALAGLVQASITRQLLTGEPVDPERHAAALADIILSGISKR